MLLRWVMMPRKSKGGLYVLAILSASKWVKIFMTPELMDRVKANIRDG